MKKLMSLLLTAALLLSGLALLASCAHTCTFATAWSSDANDHWHACENKKCTEVADKAAHTWNDGEITTKATQEAAGVKTYTCTVCSATKTEDVAFTGLTAEEWAAAINAEVFKNVTYTMVSKATVAGQESTSTMTYKITPTKMYDVTYRGDVKMNENISEDAEEIAEMTEEMAETFKHADYVYDAEAKVYKSKDGNAIDFSGMEATNVSLRFENGKLAEFKFTYQMTMSGISAEVSVTLTFKDYGTTVITETVAE